MDGAARLLLVGVGLLKTEDTPLRRAGRCPDGEKGVVTNDTLGGSRCKGFPADAEGFAGVVAVAGRHYKAVMMAGENALNRNQGFNFDSKKKGVSSIHSQVPGQMIQTMGGRRNMAAEWLFS